MFSRVMRFLLVALFSLSVVPGTANEAVAQNTTKVTELTQRTIGYDAFWAENSSESDASTGLELVILDHVDGGRVGFIFSNDQLNQADVRDVTLEGTKSNSEDYTVIDSGQYENVAYELAHFKSANQQMGIFLLVVNAPTGTTVVMVTGEVDIFKDAVGRAQAGITLDGVPTLQGIDGASLQTQLQVTEASSLTSPGSLPTAISNESETNSRQTISAASGTEYTNAAWGYTVAYGAPWEVGNQGVAEFDLLNYSPLTIVGFQGIENLGLSGYDFEALLVETFLESLGFGGEIIGTYSNQESALFIGASDGYVLIQEIIVVSPTVVVIVTTAADGRADPDLVFANLRTIRVNDIPLLSPLG